MDAVQGGGPGEGVGDGGEGCEEGDAGGRQRGWRENRSESVAEEDRGPDDRIMERTMKSDAKSSFEHACWPYLTEPNTQGRFVQRWTPSRRPPSWTNGTK